MKKTIFLAGRIDGLNLDEAMQWRKDLRHFLEPEFEVKIPDFVYKPEVSNEIWGRNYFLLDHSDILVVNMNYEDGLLTIDMNKSGSGRGVKHIKIPKMNNMTLFSDTSSLELFINDGAYAFTTRIYNNSDTIEIISNIEIDMTAYQLKAIDLEPAK